MQDRYTDTQLDWPDIWAASKLCEGGVALHKVSDGSGITDEWLITEVAPNIASVFGSTTAAVLGKALLWACFNPPTADRVLPDIKHELIAKYIQLNTGIADGVNPVEKLEVIPSEQDGAVRLDAIPNGKHDPDLSYSEGGDGREGGGGAGGRQLVPEELSLLAYQRPKYQRLPTTTFIGELHSMSSVLLLLQRLLRYRTVKFQSLLI